MSLIRLLALTFLFISSTLHATPLPEHGSDPTSLDTDYSVAHKDYTRKPSTSGLFKTLDKS
jgi:hypothetical protein